MEQKIKDAYTRVDEWLYIKYGKHLKDLDISDVPGYWRDKEATMHPGQPLHTFIGCSGPFKASYTYTDSIRDRNGRFASRTRTWKLIKNYEREHTIT